MLFGPLLLRWLFLPRAAGLVDYVVPLTHDLRKTIYVRKVKVQDKGRAAPGSNGSDHQRRDDVGRPFARFRQLVKNIPSEEIAEVRNIHV